ncbi:MAG TPA: hypothetical protein VGP82_11400 [Ktedonobacterales bacterium]|nr:hypothetical protein [Ktedonobacterales bacterium]
MVAVPQLNACGDAPERAAGQSRQDQRQRIVEPDNRFGTLPGDVTYETLVAIDDPALSDERLCRPLAEYVRRRRVPVRLPVQHIRLDMRRVQTLRQRAC